LSTSLRSRVEELVTAVAAGLRRARKPSRAPVDRLGDVRADRTHAARRSRAGLAILPHWNEHWLNRLCWLYLALALLAVGIVWGISDRHWLGTSALFGPRWLLLLPLIPLVPAAVLVRKRNLPLLALAALVALLPVMGLQFGWRGLIEPSGSDEEMLRVATLNAMGQVEPVFELVRLMRDWRVDVAAVQECSRRAADQLVSHPDWHVRETGGLCLLSRHPIESAELVEWRELDVARSQGLGGSGTLVRHRVRTPARELELVNLHLETPRKGLEQLRYGMSISPVGGNAMIREIGSRRAWEALGSDRSNLLVLGDFNMTVESSIYRTTWAEFGNAFSQAGWGFGMTKDNGWIRARIDHVLTGEAWVARRAWVGPDVGSDHWPVFAELRWVGR
jgi:vancomycin resistance protein VanJ